MKIPKCICAVHQSFTSSKFLFHLLHDAEDLLNNKCVVTFWKSHLMLRPGPETFGYNLVVLWYIKTC